MKVELSDRRPLKLSANRVGNDSGTIVKFLPVNLNPISAEREVKTSYQFNSPKGDMMGMCSVSAVMFLFIWVSVSPYLHETAGGFFWCPQGPFPNGIKVTFFPI